MFDLDQYLLTLHSSHELSTIEGRKQATRDDPLAFALIYLPDLLKNEQGEITFSEAHIEWVELAKSWMTRTPSRDCFVAPRGTGKSSWWFLILPIWAAAYGHVSYIAAFAAAADQAWSHLANFKRQMDTNQLLRYDFPELCQPKMRPNGRPVADKESRYVATSGFAFDADGIDAAVAGKMINGKRPDLLILDDIEPDASNYSEYLKNKRLVTILDNILPLNMGARVIISGTVTMAGSIIHDLVKSLTEEPEEWVASLRPVMHVHHQLPILQDDEGVERSFWPGYPERFSLELMQSIRTTPSFLKNYLNDPRGSDGDLWTAEDFIHGSLDTTGLLLSIDPAVTSKASSDFTGVALVGWSPTEKKALVVDCWAVKMPPDLLKKRVDQIIESYDVVGVLVETNQGGEVWKTILNPTTCPLAVPLYTVHQSDRKEVRAARVYTLYNRGLIYHQKPLPKLESQMIAFPKGPHDDMVDATCSGIAWFLDRIKLKKRMANRKGPSDSTYL